MIKNGCVQACLLFVGTLLGWGVFISSLAPGWNGGTGLVVSLLAAGLSTATVIGIRQIFTFRGDQEALDRATRGEPMVDGGHGAALGEIHPVAGEEPAEAPFSHGPALAYDYEISHMVEYEETQGNRRRKRLVKEVVYSGHALVPCEVRTVGGPVRLASRVLLEDDFRTLEGEEFLGRAEEFVAGTTFQDSEASGLLGVIEDVQEDLSSRETSHRHDERHRTAPADLSGFTLAERVISPGQQVCALGHYSAAAEGLVGTMSEPLRLRTGNAAAAAENVGSRKGCLTFLLVLMAVAQVIIAFNAWNAKG